MGRIYKEIEFGYGNTIEDVVTELLKYKDEGVLVSGVFNMVRLYSDTVTMDSAYKEITGYTYSEFIKMAEERHAQVVQERLEHEAQIPALVEVWKKKGREVLEEDKWEFWDEIVPVRLGDLYRGMELGSTLDVIQVMKDGGSLEEAKLKIESQDHSGMSFSLVCGMVAAFYDRGNDFVDYVNGADTNG